jgi:hypothetical protein
LTFDVVVAHRLRWTVAVVAVGEAAARQLVRRIARTWQERHLEAKVLELVVASWSHRTCILFNCRFVLSQVIAWLSGRTSEVGSAFLRSRCPAAEQVMPEYLQRMHHGEHVEDVCRVVTGSFARLVSLGCRRLSALVRHWDRDWVFSTSSSSCVKNLNQD